MTESGERARFANLIRPGTELYSAFHRLWSKSVHQEGYDKREWQAFESLVNQAGASQGAAQDWISVEDRLPELEDHMGSMESAILLFRYGSGTPHLGWMTADKQWIDYWSNTRTGSATHWMKFDERLHAPAAPEHQAGQK